MRRKINTGITIGVAVLLLLVLLMDIWTMFGQIQEQTKDEGIAQLEKISREMENAINDAKCLTLQMAVESKDYLGDLERLEKFFYEKREQVLKGNTGAFNVYGAGEDWWIIPYLAYSDDFEAKERPWYKGALQNGGRAFLSSPYQDVVTGDICYTVSVLLNDGVTVIAVDYTMDTIQTYIKQMAEEGSSYALIVTDDGIIAGCSQEELVGESLMAAVPEYAGIWSLAKRSEGFVTVRIKSDFLYDNLFAEKSGNGWSFIVSMSDWELYQTLYRQLSFTLLLMVAFCVTVAIVFFFKKRDQKRQGEDALQRKRYREERKGQKSRERSQRYRKRILTFMVLVMLISLYTIVSVTYRWGNAQMQGEASKYEHNLSNWIGTHKGILDMFASTIAANPQMLEDYEGMVTFLDGITRQFPEISASFLTNPEMEPSVYMNNGWKPDKSIDVTQRPWYVASMESETGWSMTASYYDERTGGYCVTMAERVQDVKTGAFLGVFGIDFYMDKLVEIMGDSYSQEGYAFLVDTQGNIINHPYGKYQMTQEHQTSVLELPYGKAEVNGEEGCIIRDYDGTYRILLARVNETSLFAIYVLAGARMIYGRVVLYGILCFAIFLVCIVMIHRILSQMIGWQDEVNRRLERAAQMDIMTGLYNKTATEEIISHSVRQGTGALLVIDLDSFKLVNDLYSHEMGDRVLIRFAALLQSMVREGDIVGRIGGDEFAVFCEGLTDEDTIKKKTEYLNSELLKSAREYMGSEMEIPIGCSTGVAFAPTEGREYSILFAKADLALHQVKRSGKHGVQVYQQAQVQDMENHNRSLDNLRMIFGERNLKKAALVADREMFMVIYRYMVRLATARGTGVNLMEFTLEGEKWEASCTDRFVEMAASLLTSSDVILKYNARQVILLRMETEKGKASFPVEKVLEAWEREGIQEVSIRYQVSAHG